MVQGHWDWEEDGVKQDKGALDHKGSLQKKKKKLGKRSHFFGGGVERVHVAKKTIASKSFLCNFKHF